MQMIYLLALGNSGKAINMGFLLSQEFGIEGLRAIIEIDTSGKAIRSWDKDDIDSHLDDPVFTF